MSYGNYRSSTGDLHYYDDQPRRPERWDRDRFDRFSRQSPERRESVRFEERDSYGPGRGSREVDFDEHYDRRGPRTRVHEHERFHEEERIPRRRPDFLYEQTPSEIANRALAPYRRRSIVDREFDNAQIARAPQRPGYIRRQSSLDTFDRRPGPRYGDRERDEWRPPANVPIPLPIRQRSPSRPRRYADEFEEHRYRETEPEVRDEDYREVRVTSRRESSKHRRRSRSRRASISSRSSSSFGDAPSAPEIGKKGRTRIPRRLAHKQAFIDLGLPFEEEEDFITVKRALEKEQIDEIIKISESYKETKITYKYEDVQEIEAHPPAPPSVAPTLYAPPPPPVPEYVAMPIPPPTVVAPVVAPPRSIRSESPPRTVYEEEIRESNHISGPVTLFAGPRSEREIKAEIRALEAERKLVRLERDGEYEVIERVDRKDPKREIIRVEKDRKARRRDPDAGLIGVMMSTLT